MSEELRAEPRPVPQPGQYVKIAAEGPYTGLHGWVRWVSYLPDDGRLVAAVSDTADHSHSWRIFLCSDLRIEIGE